VDIDLKQNYAVITGDFIGFSGLPASVRREMYFILKACGRDLVEAFPGIMPYEVDVFRGDGWQMLITSPALSLRSALYVRAFIKAHAPDRTVDLRLSIAVGPIDYVPDGRVSAGDGTAFRLSGKLLDRMSSPKAGSMRFAANGRDDGTLLDGLVRMTGAFADGWTARQSLAVTGALRGWPRNRIAGLWTDPVSPRAVGKHLERANWHAVEHGLTAFEGASADF
jgi:hypothetical protein